MKMINEVKEELESSLRRNDEIREQKCVRMAQNIIILSESVSSDDSLEPSSVASSGSGRSQIPTKPVMSSNKSSKFPAKHRSYNSETPLKQPHQYTFTSKQETLERIKWLHIKCVFFDTEHLLVLPKTWLEYQEYEDVQVKITQNLYNAYCMSKYFLFRNILRVGI